MKKLILSGVFCLSAFSLASIHAEVVTFQQPGPLFSFGQNILEKDKTRFSVFATHFSAKKQHFLYHSLIRAIFSNWE